MRTVLLCVAAVFHLIVAVCSAGAGVKSAVHQDVNQVQPQGALLQPNQEVLQQRLNQVQQMQEQMQQQIQLQLQQQQPLQIPILAASSPGMYTQNEKLVCCFQDVNSLWICILIQKSVHFPVQSAG